MTEASHTGILIEPGATSISKFNEVDAKSTSISRPDVAPAPTNNIPQSVTGQLPLDQSGRSATPISLPRSSAAVNPQETQPVDLHTSAQTSAAPIPTDCQLQTKAITEVACDNTPASVIDLPSTSPSQRIDVQGSTLIPVPPFEHTSTARSTSQPQSMGSNTDIMQTHSALLCSVENELSTEIATTVQLKVPQIVSGVLRGETAGGTASGNGLVSHASHSPTTLPAGDVSDCAYTQVLVSSSKMESSSLGNQSQVTPFDSFQVTTTPVSSSVEQQQVQCTVESQDTASSVLSHIALPSNVSLDTTVSGDIHDSSLRPPDVTGGWNIGESIQTGLSKPTEHDRTGADCYHKHS